MPIGSFSLIYHLADQLQKHRPKHVLDLGVGFGLSGAIVRQYLDHGVFELKSNPEFPDIAPWIKWGTRLIGIEGFEGYKNPAWELYDMVKVMDIVDYVDGTIGRYVDKTEEGAEHNDTFSTDFIILTDVLEHFTKEEGNILIPKLIKLLSPGGVLLIGTPGVFVEQGAVHGNEYERHKSLWKWNEFPPGFEVIKNGQGDEFGHYMILVKYVKPK